LILKIDENKIELTAVKKDVTTIKDIKVKFNSKNITDVLSITFVNMKYINIRRDNGTDDLIALNNNILILTGKTIRFIIKKDEFTELLSKEFNINNELLLGSWNHRINKISITEQLYYNNGTIYVRIINKK
jgi:hypothetical protein